MKITIRGLPVHRQVCVVGPGVVGYGADFAAAMEDCRRANRRRPLPRYDVWSIGLTTEVLSDGSFSPAPKNTNPEVIETEGDYTLPILLFKWDGERKALIVVHD